MNYRKLGDTNLWISEISLGSYLTYGQRLGFRESQKCIHRALDFGVNFFDTADSYAQGKAERFLGRALKKVRSQVAIATKAFYPMSMDPNDRGLSRKHLRGSAERSLKNLGTDHLDLFQCHRFDPETPLEETVRAMSELVRQGKILYWGVSAWTAGQIRQADRLAKTLRLQRPASDQPAYHLLYREIESAILPACRRLGLGVLVYSPLAQGVLTGKYSAGRAPKRSRGSDPKMRERMRYWKPEILKKSGRLKSIARRHGVTPAQLALAWCLRRPEVTSAIIGASSPRQVEENVRASGAKIPKKAFQEAEAALCE